MENLKKGFSVIEAVLFLAIIGLIAAVFVPAAVKIRKSVREDAISANVSKIVHAGQKYVVDKSVKTVDYKTLVSSKYIGELLPVAGESYDKIEISADGGKVSVDNPLGGKIEREY